MAGDRDNGPDHTAFERMMRQLFANAEVEPLVGALEPTAFDRSRRLIVECGAKLEDCRPDGGILETKSAIYKVLEAQSYSKDFVGEIGIVGAEAFAKNKHLCIHAVALPSDALWRMGNLGLSEYFTFKHLRVVYAVSEMQVHRSIAMLESANDLPESKAAEPHYWSLTLRSFAWIVIAVCAYFAIRARPGFGFWSLVAIVPFWIKAFYGVRLQATRGFSLRLPFDRLIRANDVVAILAAAAIAISVAVLPSIVPIVAVSTLLLDGFAFFSRRFTKAIVEVTAWLPNLLR